MAPLKDFCLRHCRSPMAFLLHVGTFDNQAVNGSMGIFTCREKAEQFIAGDRFVFPCMRESFVSNNSGEVPAV